MKKTLLFTLLIAALCSLTAQTPGSVTLDAQYAKQSFYSFENGEVANVPATDWDLAFACGFGATGIRINDGYGVQAYKYPNGDASEWDNVDTTGISTWTAANNSELSWSTGAFDQTADGFNVGWGDYDVITHVVTGNSIFIVRCMDQTWKKVSIESLAAGDYNFKYADLDGSNETTHALSKSSFAGKNFGYFSLVDEVEIDREPANDSWDITFTKYVAELGPGVYYGVTGVLHNNGVSAAEASGVDVTTADFQDYTFEESINVIGYDWKSFTGMAFEIPSDLTYFVNDVNGNIYQITFTLFEGSSTGHIEFETTMVMASNIADVNAVNSINTFPNPTAGDLTLELNTLNTVNALISVTDFSGRVIFNEQVTVAQGNTTLPLDLTGNTAGIYLLSVVADGAVSTQKIVLQ